ncbi:MAG: class I SAM-dependent methyltransferase [Myxococcota bacterium]
MTSSQKDIDVSYSVSNEFFELWLDKNMHYTSASYEYEGQSLEDAQEAKIKRLADFAEADGSSVILDIGCGWGSAIEYLVNRRGVKEAHGITLSTAQLEWCHQRNLTRAKMFLQDYATYEPDFKYDGLISIEMIDHLCSPAQARAGKAVSIYRQYFNTLAKWVEPGASFGFQAILSDKVPRKRKDAEDLAFTADVIFPGGRNPRLEELVQAVRPNWEIEELVMQRTDYRKTTAEWLRRMRMHEDHIRKTWGDQLFDDYDRYLSTCVRGFDLFWCGDVQMKLRRV